ncbi:hypothetical protein [Clostridium sp. MD294]|uniref:hypothetical protein n=1 Tax=Clostridium sp. MD294 TaxID=97138 RepID=UPI0002CBC401|nr:hypothetical protein [Clostridium sp. MD294]NDO46942.1 hypothetical protein [Clostridium sp. MD294]USF31395.1 hypothetical protein C820_002841 [Clostridium sp. MD294]
MSNKKCIPIKKNLISYMSKYFADFLFVGNHSNFYAFRRENECEIYDYIIIQKEFFDGILSVIITEVSSCYNKNYRAIPHFTVGYDTDIATLITAKNTYNTATGWHNIESKAEQLNDLFELIKKDIDNYVMDYFEKCHKKINSDKYMTVMNCYVQAQFKMLCDNEINSIKQYLVDVNKAYSAYRKMCKKTGAIETIEYFDIIPVHTIVQKWLVDIQKALNDCYLSKSIKMQMIKNITVLFRDNFNFYHL